MNVPSRLMEPNRALLGENARAGGTPSQAVVVSVVINSREEANELESMTLNQYQKASGAKNES